jgi:hypothetical protein
MPIVLFIIGISKWSTWSFLPNLIEAYCELKTLYNVKKHIKVSMEIEVLLVRMKFELSSQL